MKQVMVPACSVEECGKPQALRGLCSNHYQLKRKSGELGLKVPSYTQPCTVEGCGRNQASKGLCNVHYSRLRQYGDVHHTVKSKRGNCACGKLHEAHGLCKSCYMKEWYAAKKKVQADINKPPIQKRCDSK